MCYRLSYDYSYLSVQLSVVAWTPSPTSHHNKPSFSAFYTVLKLLSRKRAMLGINGGRCGDYFKVSDVLSLKINPGILLI